MGRTRSISSGLFVTVETQSTNRACEIAPAALRIFDATRRASLYFSLHCAVRATAPGRQREGKPVHNVNGFSRGPDIATPPSSRRLSAALGFPSMGAILNMPPEVRATRFSRELDRFVIEALRAVKRQGGERAFNHTARDLVISVCAILAYERGTDAVVDLFDLIERVLSDAVD